MIQQGSLPSQKFDNSFPSILPDHILNQSLKKAIQKLVVDPCGASQGDEGVKESL
jgi:hypothetical protein